MTSATIKLLPKRKAPRLWEKNQKPFNHTADADMSATLPQRCRCCKSDKISI